MKIRIFILLLLSSSYYISQAQFLDNYFDYYRKMNLAELAIIDSAYYKALDYYQQGFLEVNLPMSKDLHNASICAVKTKKFDKAFLFFERLLQKGVKLDYFKSDIYKAIHKTKEWKLFEEEYPNKMKLAESRQNAELKSIITQMHGNDQELAKKKNETHDLRPKFHTEVKKNEASFIKIIKKYGFPNEDLIGIDSPSENKVMILLIHFMQIRSFEGGGNDSLSNYLYEAVKYGQLSPYSYAYIVNLDSKNTTNYGVLAIWGINNDHRGLRKFSSEEKKLLTRTGS